MITLTRAAAKEIKSHAHQGDMEELGLRLAASRGEDGGLHYRMGFDEITLSYLVVSSSGVDVIIAQNDKPLLNGVVLDYVEMSPGEFQFIFMNPNDPHYVPPVD